MGLLLNLKTKAAELIGGGVRPLNRNSFQAQDASRPLAASLVAGDPVPGLHWNFSSLSPDRSISAVAEVIGQGRIRITVRAFAPRGRNSSVVIIVRSKTNPGAVWISKQITLDLNDGWIGIWSGSIGSAEPGFHPADAAIAVIPVKRA